MDGRKLLLWIEAIILGGPITLISLYLLPMLGATTVLTSVNRSETLRIYFVIAIAVLGLFEYWRLAICTINHEPYRFGFIFWFLILTGWYPLALLHNVIGNHFGTMFIISGSIALAVIHFSYVQLRRNSKTKDQTTNAI